MRRGSAGVDGCRGGWLVAFRQEQLELQVCPTFREVLELGFESLAIDIPIGLPELGQVREADRLARKMMGRRASCVFTTPPRELVKATDYDQVRSHGFSLQAFYIFPKIREVDELMTPSLQQRVRETHPELVFRSLAGAPMSLSKKKPEGLREREAWLPDLKGMYDRFPRKLVAKDDVVDAVALLQAAERHRRGEISQVPDNPPRDRRDLRMEICY